MIIETKTPLFFIYQNGFRQISLPPKEAHMQNPEVISLTSCDDGVLVTTEMDFKEAVQKLNAFIGHPVTEICCDTNEIHDAGFFRGAELTNGNYGERVIGLNWWKDNRPKWEVGHYVQNDLTEKTFKIQDIVLSQYVLKDIDGKLHEFTNLHEFRFATQKNRTAYQNQMER